MIIKTLSNKTVNWVLSSAKYSTSKKSKSKFQQKILDELKLIYPLHTILEEVQLPETRLKFDFVLPSLMLVIECQGLQHQEYNSFFHKDIRGFIKQKSRDDLKRQFCQINNITLVEIQYGYKESVKSIIRKAMETN